MHISAMGLMEAYQNLAKNYGVSVCNLGGNVNFSQAKNVTHAMSASGYNRGEAGVVTFTAFYYQDSTVFRTIWGAEPGSFSYYGACAPNPIIYPFNANTHNDSISQNGLYEARLIPVKDYQAATVTKTYLDLKGIGVIKTQDITAIDNIRLEATSGYINTTEPNNYTNLYSSKGFICDVTLIGKSGKTPCYIINNYDGTGTLIWKKK